MRLEAAAFVTSCFLNGRRRSRHLLVQQTRQFKAAAFPVEFIATRGSCSFTRPLQFEAAAFPVGSMRLEALSRQTLLEAKLSQWQMLLVAAACSVDHCSSGQMLLEAAAPWQTVVIVVAYSAQTHSV